MDQREAVKSCNDCGGWITVSHLQRINSGVLVCDECRAKRDKVGGTEAYAWAVKATRNDDLTYWEIAVVRSDFPHGFKSAGWFGDKKWMVSSCNGHGQERLCGFVYAQEVKIAEDLCRRLNQGEDTG